MPASLTCFTSDFSVPVPTAHGPRPRDAHARERAAARRVRARRGRRRSGARLPGRPGGRGRRRPASRPPHPRRLRLEGRARRRSASDSTIGSSAHAVAWAVAAADPREIDRINIHQASLRRHAARRSGAGAAARHRARRRVPRSGAADGAARRAARRPPLRGDCRGVDRREGDARSRRCSNCTAAIPRYGFDRHKGYATADHLDAVARFGYSDVHRRSFRPPTLFDTID